MLKPFNQSEPICATSPAAFGRLCVETLVCVAGAAVGVPAAFGRLCVETLVCVAGAAVGVPAAFGRLCVETAIRRVVLVDTKPSRLQAAVC